MQFKKFTRGNWFVSHVQIEFVSRNKINIKIITSTRMASGIPKLVLELITGISKFPILHALDIILDCLTFSAGNEREILSNIFKLMLQQPVHLYHVVTSTQVFFMRHCDNTNKPCAWCQGTRLSITVAVLLGALNNKDLLDTASAPDNLNCCCIS